MEMVRLAQAAAHDEVDQQRGAAYNQWRNWLRPFGCGTRGSTPAVHTAGDTSLTILMPVGCHVRIYLLPLLPNQQYNKAAAWPPD